MIRRLDPRILFLQGALGLPLGHNPAKPPIASPAPPPDPVPAPAPVLVPVPVPAPLRPDAVVLAPAASAAVKSKRAKLKEPGKPKASKKAKNVRRLPAQQGQDDGWGAPRRPVVLPLLAPVPAAAAPVPQSGIQPTDEQQAVVAAACDLAPGECMRVIAYAGAGKTSTMRLVAAARPEERALYLAFNRVIAAEARTSFPRWIEARTTHSLAWRALGLREDEVAKHFGPRQILGILSDGWLPENAQDRLSREISQARYVLAALHQFCQSADPAPTATHVERVLDARVYRVPDRPPPSQEVERVLAHRHGMARREAVRDLLARQVPRLWERLAAWRQHRIQISHDVYLKFFELDADLVRQSLRGYRYVILDEAQDLNPVQRSIAEKAGASVIAIGDPWQQIYSWRGAEDALEHLPGPRLHLSQSFRFGARIADAAWEVLRSKPQAAPAVRLRGSARESRIVSGTTAPVVLARSNAGVFTAAVKAARARQRVHVIGGIAELSEELHSAVALFEDRPHDCTYEPLRRFSTWQELKAEAEATEDTALRKLAAEVEGGAAIRDLALLERHHVEAENRAQVVCGTTHKAKGREWSTVALADDFPDHAGLTRRFAGALLRDKAEEVKAALEGWHVLYVAVTRAIDTLVLPEALFEWLECPDPVG